MAHGDVATRDDRDARPSVGGAGRVMERDPGGPGADVEAVAPYRADLDVPDLDIGAAIDQDPVGTLLAALVHAGTGAVADEGEVADHDPGIAATVRSEPEQRARLGGPAGALEGRPVAVEGEVVPVGELERRVEAVDPACLERDRRSVRDASQPADQRGRGVRRSGRVDRGRDGVAAGRARRCRGGPGRRCRGGPGSRCATGAGVGLGVTVGATTGAGVGLGVTVEVVTRPGWDGATEASATPVPSIDDGGAMPSVASTIGSDGALEPDGALALAVAGSGSRAGKTENATITRIATMASEAATPMRTGDRGGRGVVAASFWFANRGAPFAPVPHVCRRAALGHCRRGSRTATP